MSILNVDMLCPSCNKELELAISNPSISGRHVYNGLDQEIADLVEGKTIRCETCETTWTCTTVPRGDHGSQYLTVLYEA